MLNKRFTEYYKKIILSKIKQKGLIYVLVKATKRLINFKILIIYPIIFILCIFIRIIKPIFFIRFGCLHAEKFGPLSTRTEMSLCEQEHGLQPKRTDTFNIYNTNTRTPSLICNTQLFNMWKRVVRVYPKSRYFWNVMNAFSFGQDHIIETKDGSRDVHNLLERSPIHLSFTEKETEQGKKELLKMGLKEKDKYILIMNRTQRYLDEFLPGKMDLSHNSFRNSNINDLMPAAEMLAAKGNTIIRFGQKVGDLMKTSNPKIMEYDHIGFRTDLLDIYLSANCRYIIGSSDTGGLAVAGWNFRKPMVNVNFSMIENLIPWLPSWLFSIKKYFGLVLVIISENLYVKSALPKLSSLLPALEKS